LENHHLRHYDASFAKNFYGLKRVKMETVIKKNKPQITFSSISNWSRYGALVFLVVIPFLKTKLDELYKDLFPTHHFLLFSSDQPDRSDEQRKNRIKEFVKKIFKTIYPFISAVYEGSFFFYQLFYLYDQINYYTPFLHLQGVTLKRLSIQEMDSQNSKNLVRRSKRLRQLRGGPLLELGKLVVQVYDVVVDYSKFLLPITIFMFKFLEWWYTEASRLTAPLLPIPPPPDPPKQAKEGIQLPDDKTYCALCQNVRTNSAMIPSGYAFCYPCIFNYIKQHHKCPITFLPTEEEQIRKIYTST